MYSFFTINSHGGGLRIPSSPSTLMVVGYVFLLHRQLSCWWTMYSFIICPPPTPFSWWWTMYSFFIINFHGGGLCIHSSPSCSNYLPPPPFSWWWAIPSLPLCSDCLLPLPNLKASLCVYRQNSPVTAFPQESDLSKLIICDKILKMKYTKWVT